MNPNRRHPVVVNAVADGHLRLWAPQQVSVYTRQVLELAEALDVWVLKDMVGSWFEDHVLLEERDLHGDAVRIGTPSPWPDPDEDPSTGGAGVGYVVWDRSHHGFTEGFALLHEVMHAWVGFVVDWRDEDYASVGHRIVVNAMFGPLSKQALEAYNSDAESGIVLRGERRVCLARQRAMYDHLLATLWDLGHFKTRSWSTFCPVSELDQVLDVLYRLMHAARFRGDDSALTRLTAEIEAREATIVDRLRALSAKTEDGPALVSRLRKLLDQPFSQETP